MEKKDIIRLIRTTRPIGLIGCIVLMVLLALMSLFSFISRSNLNREMSQLDWSTPAPASAHKIIVYLEDSDEYTDLYVPQSLQTRDYREVAAIVVCDDSAELYGMYEGGQLGYVKLKNFAWYDLKTGQFLDETVFEGGLPPLSIDSNSAKEIYGSEPDASDITEWIQQTANKNLK